MCSYIYYDSYFVSIYWVVVFPMMFNARGFLVVCLCHGYFHRYDIMYSIMYRDMNSIMGIDILIIALYVCLFVFGFDIDLCLPYSSEVLWG